MNETQLYVTRRMPSWVWHVLRLLGIPFVIYVVLKVNWVDVYGMYRRLGAGTTLGMLAGLVVMFLLKVSRWSGFLRFQGIQRPWSVVFAAFGEAYFYGFLTPARLGEVYRLRHLTQWGLDPKRAVGNLAMERGMDMGLLAGLALLSLGLYWTYPGVTGLAYGTAVVAVAIVVFWLVLVTFGAARSWITQPDGAVGPLSILLRCALQTAAAWGLLYLIVYTVKGTLGIEMGPVLTLFCFVLSTLITAIPVSVAGFGTKELALIHFLGQWGYSPEQAVAFSLIFAVIYVLNLLFSGLICFAMLLFYRFGRVARGYER